MKLHHIGIAVKDLQLALTQWKILGLTETGIETIASEKVKVAFLGGGSPKIELLEPVASDSVVARFLEKRGEGIHHICYEVQNIQDTMKKLQERGLSFTSPTPKPGSQNSLVNFIYPQHFNGVLVELRQVERI